MKYRIYIAFIVLSFFGPFCTVKSSKSTTTRNIEITAEEEKLRDPEGYNSIKSIHAILDDDQSGSIDRYESADFLAEDLKFGKKERERREKTFHENDESITVDDLWEAWFESDERDWDQKQIFDWLVNMVKLPQSQCASNFQKAEVVGRYLPRIAAQNSTYLNSLGIRSIVHKQKLQLKALDIVLFGLQDSSTILKDIALACLLVILITVLIVFKTHKNRSKKQMEELSTRLSKLRDMETDFEGVQQKLDDENRKRQSMDDDENIDAKHQLNELEAEREGRMAADINDGYGLPFNLQNLLRRTFVIEWATFEFGLKWNRIISATIAWIGVVLLMISAVNRTAKLSIIIFSFAALAHPIPGITQSLQPIDLSTQCPPTDLTALSLYPGPSHGQSPSMEGRLYHLEQEMTRMDKRQDIFGQRIRRKQDKNDKDILRKKDLEKLEEDMKADFKQKIDFVTERIGFVDSKISQFFFLLVLFLTALGVALAALFGDWKKIRSNLSKCFPWIKRAQNNDGRQAGEEIYLDAIEEK